MHAKTHKTQNPKIKKHSPDASMWPTGCQANDHTSLSCAPCTTACDHHKSTHTQHYNTNAAGKKHRHTNTANSTQQTHSRTHTHTHLWVRPGSHPVVYATIERAAHKQVLMHRMPRTARHITRVSLECVDLPQGAQVEDLRAFV